MRETDTQSVHSVWLGCKLHMWNFISPARFTTLKFWLFWIHLTLHLWKISGATHFCFSFFLLMPQLEHSLQTVNAHQCRSSLSYYFNTQMSSGSWCGRVFKQGTISPKTPPVNLSVVTMSWNPKNWWCQCSLGWDRMRSLTPLSATLCKPLMVCVHFTTTCFYV